MKRWLIPALVSCMAVAAAAQDEAPDELYRRGMGAFSAGQYADAAAAFQEIVTRFGGEPQLQKELEVVFYALGCSLYNQNSYPETIQTFTEYIRRYPGARFADEAMFRIAAAQQAAESYAEAIASYQQMLAKHPQSPFAEDASFQVGVCEMAQGQFAKAAAAFDAFAKLAPESPLAAQGKVYQARAYFESGELEQALEALVELDRQRQTLDHLVTASFLALEIGDAAFDNTDYDTALRAYRRVRTRDSLNRLQNRLLERLRADFAALSKTQLDPNPAALSARFRTERRLRSSVATAEDSLKKLAQMPDYDAALFHRIGRCFFSIDRFWEARVAFTRVAAEAKDPVVREAGLYDLILVLDRQRRFPDVIRCADRYLGDYGADAKLVEKGRVPAVGFMRAEAFLNQELFEEAEKEFTALLERFPKHAQKPRIEFYLALSAAMQERFDEAIERLQAWLKDHPDDPTRPEAEYWLPVSMYYNGAYTDAIPLLLKFAQDYPMHVYAPEAEYRAALCRYAAEDFKGSALDLGAWIAKHPDHTFRWEARVTRGDALAAIGQFDAAKKDYLSVTAEGGAFRYLALTQLAKVCKALDTESNYVEMAEVFTEYAQENPDSPNFIEAVYQVGWALRKAGRPDDARKLYWSTISKHGDNRNWEGFGAILKDVRGLYGGDDAAFRADFTRVSDEARAQNRQTLLSRLVLSDLRTRRGPDTAAAAAEFAKRFHPTVLDAEGLAFIGEQLCRSGNAAQGTPYLERVLADYPDSRFAGTAYARRAEALLEQGSLEEALAMAGKAVDKAYDPVLLMEATFTRAEALRRLGRSREAIEDYTAVLASRATPRPLKPAAMLGIAAGYEALKDWRKAIPYYQRIYVMYRGYKDATAKAYLRSGAAFEQIRDWQAAIRTYEEMLGVEEMAGLPETEEARKRLEKLGGQT